MAPAPVQRFAESLPPPTAGRSGSGPWEFTGHRPLGPAAAGEGDAVLALRDFKMNLFGVCR